MDRIKVAFENDRYMIFNNETELNEFISIMESEDDYPYHGVNYTVECLEN